MRFRLFFAFALILIPGLLLSGCSNQVNKEVMPLVVNLEDSIKEIIISKGENYDFINDELFTSKVKELRSSLVKNKLIKPEHFIIGNLDNDTIPELIVFIERNPDVTSDEGALQIYKFQGEKYELLDSVKMNYDNTNYLLVAGKVSPTQNGILMSNQVGAHSGLTYGFILENGKLKSILNDKKISLLSAYTNNEIKDIDEDGVLEFSIYTIDPETSEQNFRDSDKMTLWYKWDGVDSGELVMVERINHDSAPSDKEIYENIKELIDNDLLEAINMLKENKDKLSFVDNTELLKMYIDKLKEQVFDRGVEVENLFIKYQKGNNFDYLFNKYSLSLERLNDLEYLKRERILQSEFELKDHIINNLSLGYKLDSSEGIYYYIIDYQYFIDTFEKNISKEYKDYLAIKAMNTNEPYLRDGSLVISNEKLAERIIKTENYKIVYPYSEFFDEVSEIYNFYILTFLYGDSHTPNFDYESNKMYDDTMVFLQDTINKYPDSYFSDIIKDFITDLNANGNIINDEIREKVNKNIK